MENPDEGMFKSNDSRIDVKNEEKLDDFDDKKLDARTRL